MPGQQCLTQAANGPCSLPSYQARCASFYRNSSVGTACCTTDSDMEFASHTPARPACGVFFGTANVSCSGLASIPACCCYS